MATWRRVVLVTHAVRAPRIVGDWLVEGGFLRATFAGGSMPQPFKHLPPSMRLCVQALRNESLRASLNSCSSKASRPRLRTYASVSAAKLQFGQPLHETHPHLLEAGECKHAPGPEPIF